MNKARPWFWAPALAAAPILSLAACGPGPRDNSSRVAAANVAAPSDEHSTAGQNVTVPAPRAAVQAAPSRARRCGWLHNPTPGNWWMVDREREWVLGVQGGRQAAGMDDLPDMSGAGWVETNGHYGYGCACATITADPSGEVKAVAGFEARPLRACRADKALPRP